MPTQKPRPAFPPTIAIALLFGLLAPSCGGSNRTDASVGDRPFWAWDVLPNLPLDAGVPDLAANVDDTLATNDAPAAMSPDAPDNSVDAAPEDDAGPMDGGEFPDPNASYFCAGGYLCLVDCENRCGLHDLGRSVCTCTGTTLHCGDCGLSDLARPQVPQVVSATCADGIATDVSCARVGDACFLHPDWPYPDGCLCWPTDHGLVWGCAPVFDWFSYLPGAGGSGPGVDAAAR
jgi:hypothetical protein